jgi:hypothetical protein
MLANEGKRPGVPGFRLLSVLFWMALRASGGTDVLAGCHREQQRGQYKTMNYQMNRPLN